ncbi:MAG: phosphoribosylglycinamide formyltransferase [Gammaproteobacteria bacterium]|jgi:phosphoribosylglycinamide formyltransferase-1
MTPPASVRLPVVILISGRGSNLEAIIGCAASGMLAVEIRAVISNRPDASGLRIAQAAGIPAEVVDHTACADRAAFEQALQDRIDARHPGLVVLAGFMRLLTAGFVAHYHGRMLNIHPSLLPALPGLDTHRRALEAGLAEHGASVHFVTAEVDGGPVVMQARVPVRAADTPETLAARVLAKEHRLYPLVIQWFANGRIFLGENGQILFDGKRLTQPKDLAREKPLPC